MGGDGHFFLPPCNDDPPNPLKPTEAPAIGEKLVHDCYDPLQLKSIKDIPPPPDLRSTGQKVMKGLSDLLLSKSEIRAEKNQGLANENVDPATEALREATLGKIQKEAWSNFVINKTTFPTLADAKNGYYALMRGYGLDTPKPGNLTSEQLAHVNSFGLEHTATTGMPDGIHETINPPDGWVYKSQTN